MLMVSPLPKIAAGPVGADCGIGSGQAESPLLHAFNWKSWGPLVLLVTRKTVTTALTPGPVVVAVAFVSSVMNMSFLSTLKVVAKAGPVPVGDERIAVCATPLTL